MKMLRLLSTITFLMIILTAFSQTQITYSKHAPEIGNTAVIKALYSDFEPINIDPGPSGTNVTWDFSSYVGTEEETTSFIDPAQTPFADDIAGTGVNLAVAMADDETNGYGYYISTVESFMAHGFGLVYEGEPQIYAEYDPPLVQMVYPFAYGDDFDTYSQIEISFEGMSNITKQWITVSADAWGTLTNPIGTYNDVLRVKTHTVDSVFTYVNAILFMSSGSEMIDYSWYSNEHKYMIQSIYGDLVDENLEVYGVDYLVEESAGINNSELPGVSVYPNPASDILHVGNGYGHYFIADITGRKVMEFDASRSETSGIDVSGLSEGMYILHQIENGLQVSSSKIVINR